MEKGINIIVSGPTASGKSTISLIIADALRKHGFSEVNVELGIGEAPEAEARRNIENVGGFEPRLKAIVNKVNNINIYEQNTKAKAITK